MKKLTEEQKQELVDRFKPLPETKKDKKYKITSKNKIKINGESPAKLWKKVKVSPKMLTEIKRMVGME